MLSKIYKFTVMTFQDDLVRSFDRDSFSSNCDGWRFVRRNRKGEILDSFSILESTAELALHKALLLQKNRPDLVSVEVEKFSYTREFQENLRKNPFPCFPLHY
jgi:hypothetical protein